MARLSIYIPTWNRPQYLSRLLASIKPQLTNDVDVYVSINHSTAHYELPDWIQSRTTRINIGGDANIISGPSLVTGDYVWVIGDDDQLLPYAIKTTLAALKSNPGLIIHTDGRMDIGINYGSVYPTYGNFCQTILERGNPQLICAHTLISSNTFRRDVFDTAYALQRIDSRYGFHYGMLTNNLNNPVKLLDKPTMKYDHHASIFQASQTEIDEHMAAYPKVINDIYDWITARTGVHVPHNNNTRGFV